MGISNSLLKENANLARVRRNCALRARAHPTSTVTAGIKHYDEYPSHTRHPPIHPFSRPDFVSIQPALLRRGRLADGIRWRGHGDGLGRPCSIRTDSTTIAANPAGMLALKGSRVSVVAMPIGLDLRFHGDGETPGSAVNEQRTVPTMSVFAARHAGRWALGLGAYGNIGLGCDFGKEWSGRRAIEDAELGRSTWRPRLPTVSTTALASAHRSARIRRREGRDGGQQRSDLLRATARPARRATAHDRPHVGSGGEPGARLRTEGGTRLGLAWTSTVDHSLEQDVRASAVHPLLAGMLQQQGAAQLDVSLPQQFNAQRGTTGRAGNHARSEHRLAAMVGIR